MKYIAATLLLALIAAPASASMTAETCPGVGQAAASMMEGRLKGLTMSEQMRVWVAGLEDDPGTSKLVYEMVSGAYSVGFVIHSQTTYERKQEIIKSYGDTWESKCWELYIDNM